MKLLSRFAWKLLGMAVTTAIIAPAVFAQGQAPPAPTLSRNQPVWIGYAFMFLMTMAILFISLMPSKRSHQD
jgi:uncharacterized membrane protein